MAAAEVLQMLASSETKLSDALRQASLLPEVRDDPVLLKWIELEITGYGSELEAVPDYRRRNFTSVGNAFNGTWRHTGVVIPLPTFSSTLQEYGSAPTRLVQSIGTLEGLLESGSSGFQIPWQNTAEAVLNGEIRNGDTGIDTSYLLTEIRWDVPRPVVQEIIEIVRHRAMSEVTTRIPVEQLEAKIAEALPAAPSGVAIQGSANQVIVGSPGAFATLTVNVGDRSALNDALASLGIRENAIEQLHEIVDDDTDDASKVMKALSWSRAAAKELGINTAGAAAATLILQYLGLL